MFGYGVHIMLIITPLKSFFNFQMDTHGLFEKWVDIHANRDESQE